MGDPERELPSTKKRAAGREISRDNPGLDDDEDVSEQETGTFKRASDEVLAARRIVKVRRPANPPAASSNPFAKISLVPPPNVESNATLSAGTQTTNQKPAAEEEADSGTVNELAETEHNGKDKQLGSTDKEKLAESFVDEKTKPAVEGSNLETTDEKGEGAEENEENKENKDNKENEENKENKDNKENEENKENEDNKENEENKEKEENKENEESGEADPSSNTASLSSFQQLSSTKNAFTGLAGTGFSGSSFSFGTPFGLTNDKPPSFPPLNLGNSSNGSSLFGSSLQSNATKSEGSGIPSMQEVPVETGEENEKAVFTADAVLFEYLDGGWKERGKGELKVNVSTTGDRARLIMRARGNYRLILNASLYPDMKLTNMDKRGITFACLNSSSGGEGKDKDSLSTFALKFKDSSFVEEFRSVVNAHKSKKTTTVLKTPDNSPKASDD